MRRTASCTAPNHANHRSAIESSACSSCQCTSLAPSLALVTVMGAMLFGALSGSGVADVVAIGTMMLPAMRERGYDPGFSCALLGCAGSLGTVIPPSIVMIVYGTATDSLTESVTVSNPGLTSYTVEKLSLGTWYFAVIAVNAAGESEKSNVATKIIL